MLVFSVAPFKIDQSKGPVIIYVEGVGEGKICWKAQDFCKTGGGGGGGGGGAAKICWKAQDFCKTPPLQTM